MRVIDIKDLKWLIKKVEELFALVNDVSKEDRDKLKKIKKENYIN